MRNNYSVIFLVETLRDLDERNPQSAKFQTFNSLHEISPKFYFDRLLLLKVYQI